ncbi:MAG: acyl-CoA dehydrogenase family protein [Gaiellales bacterium]
MSFELSRLDRRLVAHAREFAERELRPVAAHYDETEEFPWPVLRRAAEAGLTCFDLPETFGGGGIESLLTGVHIYEELAWGDSSITGCFGGGSFFAGPVLELGSEEQQRRWVTPVCGPEPPVGALALTEPECGSDAAAISTHAKRVDDGYVLNGRKTWISNAPVADLYVVFATVAPGTRSKGITAFVVEKGDAGFEPGRSLPKLGARCYPAGELFFRDCHLPDDRRLGDEGTGFHGLMRYFDRSRVALAANAVGIGRAALEVAVEYARERHAFGKPIHEYQAVSFRLADVKLAVDQARLMTHHAARLADAGKPFTTEASMAKLAASEAAWLAAWAAVQTLGANGYSREYPAERLLRNAKLEEIYEGTSDIQRLVIARSMFRG